MIHSNRYIKCLYIMLLILLFFPSCSLAAKIQVYQIWDDYPRSSQSHEQNVNVCIETNSGNYIIADSKMHLVDGEIKNIRQLNLPDNYKEETHLSTHDGIVSVIFINHRKAQQNINVQNKLTKHSRTASLTIHKDADYSSPDDVFWFNVSLPGIYSYKTSSGTKGTTNNPIPLRAGESVIIEKVPVGSAYSIEEKPDPRYITECESKEGIVDEDGIVVYFKNTFITTSFSIKKIWEGTPKGTINLYLYADNTLLKDVIFQREGNIYSVYNLPKYTANGREIIYSAKEEYMDGYMTMYINQGKHSKDTHSVYNGGKIVNREVTSFYIKKEWVGADDHIHPKITFQLYQNGKPIAWRQPDSTASGLYIWRNLPLIKNGEKATYSAKEIPLRGYLIKYKNLEATTTEYALNGCTIVNYKIPETSDKTKVILAWILIAGGTAGLIVCFLCLKSAKKG